jgi:ubiquinone/menaquinone biosynthesis C-methylase UbiE
MIAPRKNDKVQGQVMPRGRRVSLTFRQALLPGDIASSRLCASQVEYEHVYKVYDSIALHWHHTRGKRKVHWHRVKSFLDALAPGSFMADIGSGDGKYFGLNPSCLSIGCDRSLKLLEVSKNVSFESFCCDAVKVPFRSDIFDAVICIAVLHHMASIDRRVSVVRELLRICRVGGRVMLQAWAMEQESGSKKNFSEQDVLVPWKLQVVKCCSITVYLINMTVCLIEAFPK